MASFKDRTLKLVRSSPSRTFIAYPVLVILWEFALNKDRLDIQPLLLPIMLWGYLQYRLCSNYRKKQGGGRSGSESPPDHLVTSGVYAWTRNPIYLGQIVFLAGLALTFTSLGAGVLTIVVAARTHSKVLDDEKRLVDLFGQPYAEYRARVKRWLPALF
jgi:protein-S-isoprenylcysteine O-methyltransferase Ste14